MNLGKKKNLAAKTLGVGKDRIVFNVERISEIKEAITRQDIRDLYVNKAITVKDIKGRKKVVGRKTRRRGGSIRKKVKKSKTSYVLLTRKLRAYIQELKGQDKINQEQYLEFRKNIRNSNFRSKAHLKESLDMEKNGKVN